MIIAVIAERRADDVRRRLEELAEAWPDGQVMAEVRLDLLDEITPEVVRNAPVPVIATCRRPADGGQFWGSETERIRILLAAVSAGAEWIDVEHDALHRVEDRPESKLLVSIHDFMATPGDLGERTRDAFARGADHVKIAVRPGGLLDILNLRRIAEGTEGPVTAFGLGPGGVASRLLFRRMGSEWVYAAAGRSRSERLNAPGLPTLDDLTSLYYPNADLPEPVAVFGVLSDRAEDSVGPVVFNRIFRRMGIPALYVPISTSSLVGLREFVKVLRLRGLSVTTPFKEQVLELVDGPGPRVMKVGAANTLLPQGGAITAHNTDWDGVGEPVAEALAVPGKLRPWEGERAIVIGTGGAGRAAAAALTDLGLEVKLAGRTPSRVAEAAESLGLEIAAEDEAAPKVLVNATPAGGPRDPEGCAVPDPWLAKKQLVIEMNYTAAETTLQRRARKKGAKVISGAVMYAAQARHQLRHFWRGAELEPGQILEEVEEALRSRARAESSPQ